MVPSFGNHFGTQFWGRSYDSNHGSQFWAPNRFPKRGRIFWKKSSHLAKHFCTQTLPRPPSSSSGLNTRSGGRRRLENPSSSKPERDVCSRRVPCPTAVRLLRKFACAGHGTHRWTKRSRYPAFQHVRLVHWRPRVCAQALLLTSPHRRILPQSIHSPLDLAPHRLLLLLPRACLPQALQRSRPGSDCGRRPTVLRTRGVCQSVGDRYTCVTPGCRKYAAA